MEKVQTLGQRFEETTRSTLKKLGFKDINGGTVFYIGGNQVDACGGYEDTLVIVECTTSTKKDPISLREKIKQFRGEIPSLSKGFHKDANYLKYKHHKYILAVSNIEIREQDDILAKESPKIHIWDQQFIDYYTDLFGLIGDFAIYNLLGEMGVEPGIKDSLQVPALATMVNKSRLYLFFINPHELLRASYVARREVGKEHYYQRILKKDRLDKIKRFLEHGKFFPNNIIVAFNKKPDFTVFTDISPKFADWPEWLKFGLLTFPANYRACWIIDGQHRLYAYSKVHTDSKLLVAAFENITIEKQAEYFIEINREQKLIDPDLLWDLEGEMRRESKEGQISNIVKKLNGSDPLNNMIYIPLEGKRAKGQLKFSGLCLSIQKAKLIEPITSNMLAKHKNPLFKSDFNETVNKVAKALAEYLQNIDKILTNEEKNEYAFTNSGIFVMVTLFELILAHEAKYPTEEEFSKYIAGFKQFIEMDYPSKTKRSSLRQMSASEGGRHKIMAEIVESIRSATGDDTFGPGFKGDDIDARVKIFERALAGFVFNILNVKTTHDLEKCTTKDICNRITERMEKAMAKGIDKQVLSQYSTLGECKVIIQETNNAKIFDPVFVSNEHGFIHKSEMNGALQAITDCSADIRHGRSLGAKYKEKERIEIYMDIFMKCIETYSAKNKLETQSPVI